MAHFIDNDGDDALHSNSFEGLTSDTLTITSVLLDDLFTGRDFFNMISLEAGIGISLKKRKTIFFFRRVVKTSIF